MTGITKDELMQIMKEAMALEVRSPHVFSDGSLNRAAYVANAILDRAAVECDKVEDFYWHGECALAASSCGQAVRALKINTGD